MGFRARGTAPSSLPKRLLWFVVLWLGGVAAVAVVGLVIKFALRG